MEIEQLNYGIGTPNDNDFKLIKNNRIIETIDIKPEQFDYMLGNISSLRYEWIKDINDNNEKIYQMTLLLREILPQGLPDEFYDWYARETLGLQYTKYEINDMKRKYKINRRREIEKKKKEDRLEKERVKFIKKVVVLDF